MKQADIEPSSWRKLQCLETDCCGRKPKKPNRKQRSAEQQPHLNQDPLHSSVYRTFSIWFLFDKLASRWCVLLQQKESWVHDLTGNLVSSDTWGRAWGDNHPQTSIVLWKIGFWNSEEWEWERKHSPCSKSEKQQTHFLRWYFKFKKVVQCFFNLLGYSDKLKYIEYEEVQFGVSLSERKDIVTFSNINLLVNVSWCLLCHSDGLLTQGALVLMHRQVTWSGCNLWACTWSLDAMSTWVAVSRLTGIPSLSSKQAFVKSITKL